MTDTFSLPLPDGTSLVITRSRWLRWKQSLGRDGALTLLFAEYSEAAKGALKEMLKDD